LASPLHDLSERSLFSAHMVQHVLLTLVAPPLLLAGTPGWMIRPLVRIPLVRGPLRLLTSPLIAFLFFNVVFGVSHVPRLYDLILGDHPLHIVEHLVFLASAILAWWPILSPLPELPRLPYPLQVLYLFLQTIPGSIVGAMITLADDPLYAVYAAAPRVWGISPIADQQIGGLIMWVGGGTYFLIAATTVFFIWAAREDTHATV
ncbi:MAG TPA: cytochrome c oxidase assembly protein, partial [Roseiflexaceae bacterium]